MTAGPEPPVVRTEGGPVTLSPLAALRDRIRELTDWSATATTTSAAWDSEADDQFAAAGAILVPHSGEWAVPAGLQKTVDRAKGLVAQIGEHDQTSQQLKEQESHGNLLRRVDAWRHERNINRDRTAEAADLRRLLIEIAKGAPASTVAEADTPRGTATQIAARAAKLDKQIDEVRNSLAAMTQEVAQREASIQAMGFDALYEAALLQTSGAAPVESPLLLKSGEVAYLSMPATLARMVTRTHYVGGTSGVSFPIGHTGIRYRVGGFSGHPVQQQSLTNLDSGTLVLTSLRIAFIGRTKSTSIALARILHVEVYTDALAVFQEARENPDFYMIPEPKRATFLLNWILQKNAASKT